jgi:hypothetical protein
LRHAHLHESVPWSRMAVIVRSLQHHHAALRRALTQAGVPVTTEPRTPRSPRSGHRSAPEPTSLCPRMSTLDEGAAVDLLHSALGGADPFLERKLRQGLRAVAAASGETRRPVSSWSRPCSTPAPWQWLSSAGPVRLAPSRGCSPPLAPRGSPGANAEDVLWRCGGPAGWPNGGRPRARAGADAAQTPIATSTRCWFSSMPRRGFTDRLPGARVEVFLDHPAGPAAAH